MTSATTQPVFDPTNVMHWSNVLHNAARVPKTDPDYENARAMVQLALGSIGELNAAANAKEGQPGTLPSSAVAFGQGASLGAASNIGDVLTPQSLVRGFGNMEGAAGRMSAPAISPEAAYPQTNTAYLSAAREAHPVATTVADALGTTATSYLASPLVAGAGPVVGGGALVGGTSAIRGAFEPLPGFSRAETATLYGIGGGLAGAAGGYVVGKFITKALPGLRAIGRNIRKLYPGAPTNELAKMTEQAVREELLRQYPQIRPEVLERTVTAWRTGKVTRTPIPPPMPPPEPPTLRPGETVTPITAKPDPSLEQATFLRRGTTLRQDVSPISGNRALTFRTRPDVGQGQTLPYYARGGKVEQAFAPFPASSPATPGAVSAEGQMAAIQQYLRSLTPEQLPDAIAGAQALGIPLGGTPEQIMALLLRR